ncbi:hypothetical protein [uncultured Flavobacterium sp.]|uniref:hypothetical protein n=1 Tax=uncultured Flavobacterium sp. TaxID=165435 RepID=UPI0030CA2CCE
MILSFPFSNEKNSENETIKQTMIHFYQQLGKVFYRIASADKVVQKEEIAQLNEIIKNQWLALEDSLNELGDDAAYQIEMVFDSLVENEV